MSWQNTTTDTIYNRYTVCASLRPPTRYLHQNISIPFVHLHNRTGGGKRTTATVRNPRLKKKNLWEDQKLYWNNVRRSQELFPGFSQPMGPRVAGWCIPVSRVCSALRNSSELRCPSWFVSNTWKMMSTTLSVNSTPQTYNANQGRHETSQEMCYRLHC